MILCKHCGWPVLNVLCDCFDHEGYDTEVLFPIREPNGHDGVAEFDLPTSWCGYELYGEEQKRCSTNPTKIPRAGTQAFELMEHLLVPTIPQKREYVKASIAPVHLRAVTNFK